MDRTTELLIKHNKGSILAILKGHNTPAKIKIAMILELAAIGNSDNQQEIDVAFARIYGLLIGVEVMGAISAESRNEILKIVSDSVRIVREAKGWKSITTK